MEGASKWFDDDSKENAKLMRYRDRVLKSQANVAKKSSTLSQESLTEKKMGTVKARMNNLRKVLFKEVIGGLKKALTKEKKVKVDQFAKWDASEEKTDVVVTWAHNEGDIKLGVIKMDLDAPSNIAREYCRRSLREGLNSRCGENFMMHAKGEGMALEDEERRRIGQLAPQKFNTKTREIEHTLVLCANPSTDLLKADIPFIKSKEAIEKERKMEEAMLASLSLEEHENLEGIEMSEEDVSKFTAALVNCAIKTKTIQRCFNKKGFLIPEQFNETTSELPTETRVMLKKILDSAMGVTTLITLDEKTEEELAGFGAAPDGKTGEDEGATGTGVTAENKTPPGSSVGSVASNAGPNPPAATAAGTAGADDDGVIWETYKDEQGFDYFYNPVTQESSYDKPASVP